MKLILHLMIFAFLGFANSLKTEGEVLFLKLNDVRELSIEYIVDSSAIIPDFPDSYTTYKFYLESSGQTLEIEYFYYEDNYEVNQQDYYLRLDEKNQITVKGSGGYGTPRGEQYEYNNDTIEAIGSIVGSGNNPDGIYDVIRRLNIENNLIREVEYFEDDELGLSSSGTHCLILCSGCSVNRNYYLYSEDWKWTGCFDIENDAMLDSMHEYGFKEFTKKFVWNEEYEEYFNKQIRHKPNSNEGESDFYINGEPVYEFLNGKVEPMPDNFTITIFPDFFILPLKLSDYDSKNAFLSFKQWAHKKN